MLTGYAVLVVLFIISLFFAVHAIDGLRRHQTEVATRTMPYVAHLGAAAQTAKGAATDERGYLLKGNQKFVTEFTNRVPAVASELAAARTVATSDDARANVDAIQAAFTTWSPR